MKNTVNLWMRIGSDRVDAPAAQFQLLDEVPLGRGRVYLYSGEKRFFVARGDFTKAPLELECEGLKSGDEGDIWAALGVSLIRGISMPADK